MRIPWPSAMESFCPDNKRDKLYAYIEVEERGEKMRKRALA